MSMSMSNLSNLSKPTTNYSGRHIQALYIAERAQQVRFALKFRHNAQEMHFSRDTEDTSRACLGNPRSSTGSKRLRSLCIAARHSQLELVHSLSALTGSTSHPRAQRARQLHCGCWEQHSKKSEPRLRVPAPQTPSQNSTWVMENDTTTSSDAFTPLEKKNQFKV